MSGSLHAWYSLRDLEALGARHAVISGAIDVSRLTRLKDLLHKDEGSVKASLRFGQHGAGWVTLELQYQTALQLICQRCLEPFEHHMDERVQLALVESAALESSVPQGHEPIVLEDDRTSPAQLIEDELIVSLPLVPKHARIADCGTLARSLGPETEVGADREDRPPRD